MESTHRIAVIGLGYVGLPLAVAFAQKYACYGFDINRARIDELRGGLDRTLEIGTDELRSVLGERSLPSGKGLYCTDQRTDLAQCNVYIVTVPTPTDRHNRPDLGPIYRASETVAAMLKKGDLVIYESTVYPGVTEEECVPVLEKGSGLRFNEDFFCGYSPERINPGDKVHTLARIKKVTSGSTPEIAATVNELYLSIIEAGTHLAPSIRVAEAAKVIENSQRDINIAFVNELAKIFNLLQIDTQAVLEAAGTKWNFLKFKPGLVGGHCIGVDPYYLAQKAQEAGYHPEIILAGRRLNDSMGAYIAGETIKLMVKKEIPIKKSRILVLGFSFKENCPDVRNTRVINIVQELATYQAKVDVYDPWADAHVVKEEYGIDILPELQTGKKNYDAIILAVAHEQFSGFDLAAYRAPVSVVYDVKGFLPGDQIDARL